MKEIQKTPKYPEVGARLAEFIAASGEPNARQFALRAGLSPQLVSHTLQGHSIPGGAVLMALTLAYRDFDSDWLLTGKRKALVQPAALVPPRTVAVPAAADYGADLVAQAENVLLREHLAALRAWADADRETIAWLKAELGKSSGSADATGRFAPTAPRPVIDGFQTSQQQAAAAASAMLTASFRARHNKRSGGVSK